MARIVFTDVNTRFGFGTKPELLNNVGALNNEIANVLSIMVGEYWWEPTFGTNLPSYLHEPVDAITAAKIRAEVINLIPFWIPYIELTGNTSVLPSEDDSGFNLYIEYYIKPLNQIAAFTAQLTN